MDTNYDWNGDAIRDEYDDTCIEYAMNTDWCGHYNTDTFNSDMCCACGGGEDFGPLLQTAFEAKDAVTSVIEDAKL